MPLIDLFLSSGSINRGMGSLVCINEENCYKALRAVERRFQRSSAPERLKQVEDSLSTSGGVLAEEQRKVEAKGTFNALAARGLGADSLSERTARAAAQIVVNTKDLLAQAKQGKLVFAP